MPGVVRRATAGVPADGVKAVVRIGEPEAVSLDGQAQARMRLELEDAAKSWMFCSERKSM